MSLNQFAKQCIGVAGDTLRKFCRGHPKQLSAEKERLIYEVLKMTPKQFWEEIKP